MVNINLLKDTLKEGSINIETAASKIGIDASTFYRRLQRDGSNFTVEEVGKLAELLNLSSEELQRIFFER